MKVTLYLIKYYAIQMCRGVRCDVIASPILRGSYCPGFPGKIPGLLVLTLRLLMSHTYGAPSKARNANVVYIWTYVWQR